MYQRTYQPRRLAHQSVRWCLGRYNWVSVYFKSIYTNDPDGHIVELATLGPGFAIDEEVASLGTRLRLPPWLEPNRSDIEAVLQPLHMPEYVGARP